MLLNQSLKPNNHITVNNVNIIYHHYHHYQLDTDIEESFAYGTQDLTIEENAPEHI